MAPMPPGMVGVPAADWMWTQSAVAIFRNLRLPRNSTMEVDRAHSAIDTKRNFLVRAFLERRGLEWLCFVDSDMMPEADAIERLLTRDVECRIGLYLQKSVALPGRIWEAPCPWQPASECALVLPEEVQALRAENPLMPVDLCGAGFLLVKRRVLEQLDYPWFKCWDEHPGTGEDIRTSAIESRPLNWLRFMWISRSKLATSG